MLIYIALEAIGMLAIEFACSRCCASFLWEGIHAQMYTRHGPANGRRTVIQTVVRVTCRRGAHLSAAILVDKPTAHPRVERAKEFLADTLTGGDEHRIGRTRCFVALEQHITNGRGNKGNRRLEVP